MAGLGSWSVHVLDRSRNIICPKGKADSAVTTLVAAHLYMKTQSTRSHPAFGGKLDGATARKVLAELLLKACAQQEVSPLSTTQAPETDGKDE